MKPMLASTLATAAFVGAFAAPVALATGLATCDSGPPSGWQPQAKLEKDLTGRAFTVVDSRIQRDGGDLWLMQ